MIAATGPGRGAALMLGLWLGAAAVTAAQDAAAVPGGGGMDAVPVSPRRLIEVVDLSGPTVSPDGRRVVFRAEHASVERDTYDSTWYVQEVGGRVPPRRVGDGGVPLRDSAGGSLPAAASWSPDGAFIYYRAVLDGRIDVWRASADGAGAQAVTSDPADVRAFVLSDDGTVLRYSVGATREEVQRAERAEYERGIRIDETVPVGASLYHSSRVGVRLATQRYTGTWFDRGPLLADVPDRWREIDLATEERRELPAPQMVRTADAAPDALPTTLLEVAEPHSGRVAVLSRADGGDRSRRSDRAGLSVQPRGGRGRAVRCTAAPCTDKAITSVQWRPGGEELLFTVTDRAQGLAQSIFRWNLGTGTVQPVVAARGLVGGGRDASSTCGLSADALLCVASEADGPPRLERIDIRTGARRVLFAPNAALESDLAASISSRLLRWEDAEGNEYSAYLFEARQGGAARRPLFINYYYCAGFLRGGMGDEWPLASLAGQGISTLCINAAPPRSDPVVRFDSAIAAVRSAVDVLEAEGRVDRSRIGMGGLSLGSEAVLWVTMHSDLLAAASVTSPSVTPIYHLMGSVKGDKFVEGLRAVWGLGSPEQTPEQWKRLSPAYGVDRIHAPILFQMPEEEYVYALEYAVPLMQANLADMYVFPDEPHRKFQPRHMQAVNVRNLDWFRFWLQDVEDPDHRKTGQYAHWREMRERGRLRASRPEGFGQR